MKSFSKSVIVLFTLLLIFENISCSKTDSCTFEAMDTYMKIQSYGSNAAKANKLAQEKILQLESLFSVTDPESEIYKINNSAESGKYTVHPETAYAINQELKMAELTDGALNPVLYPVTRAWGFTTGNYRIPSQQELKNLVKYTDYKKVKIDENTITKTDNMMFDLGAVGKGFAGDEAIKILRKKGIKSAILDLGGNIQVIGKKTDGSYWKVGIKDPWNGGIAAGIPLDNQAVITSGGYERHFTTEDGQSFIHIIDGRTGLPVNNEIVSSSIITSSGAYGDALSTATFILGKEKAVELWKKLKDFEMILMFSDHSVSYTQGLEGKISFLQDFDNIEVIK